MSRTAIFAAVLASATLLTACSTTVAGTPSGTSPATAPSTVTSASPSTTAAHPIPVPAGLDFGGFTTKPRTIPASEQRSWVAEGNRMGDALIQVNEVDPRLTIGGVGLRSYPVVEGQGMVNRVPDNTSAAFAANSMRVGMTTTRGDALKNPSVAVRIGLYRFGSDADAQKTLTAIRAATADQPPVTVTVDGATVVASEFKPGTVDAYLVQGPFAVNVSGTAPTTAEATSLATKAFTLELAKLKSFTPTPVDQVVKLDVDRDGILSRTLPYETGNDANLFENWYDFTGLLHRVQDITNTTTHRAAGIDLVGEAGSVVYRTKDDAAATAMVQTIAGKNPPVTGIPQLPSVKCMTGGDKVYCWIPVGRLVASVYDPDAAVARQKAAAQFSILATAN